MEEGRGGEGIEGREEGARGEQMRRGLFILLPAVRIGQYVPSL